MERTGSKLTNLTDEELIKLAAGQHQTAFIILYTRYNAGVRSHISRYVTQKEEVEDICLESFQKAFSQIHTFLRTGMRVLSSFIFYLYIIPFDTFVC